MDCREQLALTRRYGGNSNALEALHALDRRGFRRNVMEARESGYAVVCAECGFGLALDDNDAHDRGCSHDG